MRFTVLIGGGFSLVHLVTALNNGLAVTPQMGWDNWNAFGCSLSQSLILSTASFIKKTGLRDAGYHYIILDDCWSSGRASNGALIPDSTKFPNGMSYLGNQLHADGFGFGIYSSAGTKTCAGYPGSLGYETIDANTFASWGVDYLKYDNCNNNGQSGSQAVSSARYAVMQKALAASGRQILYAICNWGEDKPWIWGPSVGNSWRITGDISDHFNTAYSTCPVPNSGGYQCSVTQIMSMQATISSYSAKGGWNDLDMLEVGNGGMSDAQYVAHFSMWSAAKSPLIMGNDMSKLTASGFSILANPAVIAVNQDPLGVAASYRWTRNNVQLWSGPLASTTGGSVNDVVVVLFNNGGSSTTASATLSEIFELFDGFISSKLKATRSVCWIGFRAFRDDYAVNPCDGMSDVPAACNLKHCLFHHHDAIFYNRNIDLFDNNFGGSTTADKVGTVWWSRLDWTDTV
ncbi:glycoside hydrolase family 27 protein [Aspergillus terreus]|uniref:Alpha-galactosidase n=1 Tax=Aspergillus terreus TaxID=33178 RepID=A0A5M3YY17_ASPTE|nr:hypothetical protein ATETN484_0005065400 [Aspergillus terreus]GFF17306.1 glycoside hydrolase family 27 protein [Aspergillus terreus]